jgi:steroid delta-isomerase-like uncharacterized protein
MTTQTTAQNNATIARTFCEEVWGKGNLEALHQLTRPDFRIFYPIMTTPMDRDSYGGLMADVHTAFPDFRVTLNDIIAKGEKVVIAWTAEGTHTGHFELLNLPPTGNAIRYTGMVIYRIDDGYVAEGRGEEDIPTLLRQLRVWS